MEKMIKVINDNLRTVINGIKTHKSDTEASLATITGKMDDRVKLAGEYRSNVESSRQIISTLENEISALEKDLEDLKNKFSSKDFKEIVVVGSKEVNNKIAEKKSLIAEQSQKILALTDKAHRLKNELIALKEKRVALEATLDKDNVLEAYYESKITEIIEFAEEHTANLKEYISIQPQSTLMTSTTEVENIDITTAIDGSVFEEIEEINNSTDSEELDIYINDVLEEGTIDLTDIDPVDNDDDDDDESMTKELDDIINDASVLLEKSMSLEDKKEDLDFPVVEEKPFGETINLDDVKDISTPAPMYIEDNDDDESEGSLTLLLNNDEEDLTEEEMNAGGFMVSVPEDEEVLTEEEMMAGGDAPAITEDEIEAGGYAIPEFIDESEEPIYNPEEVTEEDLTEEEMMAGGETPAITEEEINVEEDKALDTEDEIELSMTNEIEVEPYQPAIHDEETSNDDVGNLGELNLTTPDDLELDEEYNIIDEEKMFSALDELNKSFEEEEIKIEDEEVSIIAQNDEQNNHENVVAELKEANLDVNKFQDEELSLISEKYVKDNIKGIITILRKHNIASSKIYENAHILANMTAEELDYVLTLLEKTNASSDALSYVIGMLDKVDIYKLEEKISSKSDYELSELLYDTVPYEGEVDLAEKLDLMPSELNILRSVASKDEYERINQFSDIFVANYNELKKYNVNNLKECIIKHPHRFLFNPDNFAAILDKYDPEDLTRCVNKNAAVIDKL